MIELIAAFSAGVLTILAPCILPLLPVILGSSILQDGKKPDTSWRKPLTIIVSLGLSVVVFTLLLKFSTSLLGIPAEFWSIISGTIVVILGLSLLFPHKWETVLARAGLGSKSQKLLAKSSNFSGTTRDIMTGFALGPVFNSCSPTYLYIVAVALPASFLQGFSLLTAYVIGLCGSLLLIALLGRSFTVRIASFASSEGKLKKSIGILLIIVGVLVLFGVEKDLQTFILDKGWYQPISNLEMKFE